MNAGASSTFASNSPEERAVIERIVALMPPKDQASVREYLADATKSFGSDRPELAPLVRELNLLRHARIADVQATRLQKDADVIAAHVRVSVALAPALGDNSVRAVVVRRPGDSGRPLLLLREEDVTADDVAFGLAFAAQSISKYGVEPKVPHRQTFRAGGVATSTAVTTKTHGAIAADLRRADYQTIQGIGRVRAMDVFTRKR